MSEATGIPKCPHIDDRQELIRQGAEARLYRTYFRNQECLAKERFEKTYRIPELDQKLRKRQTSTESKTLKRAWDGGVLVPEMLHCDSTNNIIYMKEIKGKTVRDYLLSLGDLTSEDNIPLVDNLAVLIGSAISDLHALRIIHGDLTTSNMVLPDEHFKETLSATATAAEEATLRAAAASMASNSNPTSTSSSSLELKTSGVVDYAPQPRLMPTKLALIDFGLAFTSDLVEDRAVDHYVMERAIETTHLSSERLIHKIFNTYKNKNVLGNKVMSRLNDVRARGRKKSMVG